MAHNHQSNEGHENNIQSRSTYANVAARSGPRLNPHKFEHAIIIEAVRGLSNDDYLDALEEITDIKNIKGISKISGDRISVFLNDRNLVNELKNRKIQVKEYVLNIRPLLSCGRRVVISNVSLAIPNEVIEEALKKINIQIVSQITNLRASLSKPGREHILSFRRQFYIREEDLIVLPETVILEFDNTAYRAYLTTENATCFICKQPGHTAKNCSLYRKTTDASPTQVIPMEDSGREINNDKQISTITDKSNEDNTEATNSLNLIRASSELRKDTLSQKYTDLEATIAEIRKNKSITKGNSDASSQASTLKKRKVDTIKGNKKQIDIHALASAVDVFKDINTPSKITFSEFLDFMYRSRESKNVGKEALQTVESIPEMIFILNKVYEKTIDKKMKACLTRVKNKLIKNAQETSDSISTDHESDALFTDSENERDNRRKYNPISLQNASDEL